MDNYEAWLNQEVYQNDDNRSNLESYHQSHERILGDIVSLDSSALGTTSLFSATKKFNKNIFGDSYTDKNRDDFEWCCDDYEENDENDELSSASENEMGWDYPLDKNDEIWN